MDAPAESAVEKTSEATKAPAPLRRPSPLRAFLALSPGSTILFLAAAALLTLALIGAQRPVYDAETSGFWAKRFETPLGADGFVIQQRLSFSPSPLPQAAFGAPVFAVDVADGGRRVAAAGRGGEIAFWRIGRKTSFAVPSLAVFDVLFSGSGDRIFYGDDAGWLGAVRTADGVSARWRADPAGRAIFALDDDIAFDDPALSYVGGASGFGALAPDGALDFDARADARRGVPADIADIFAREQRALQEQDAAPQSGGDQGAVAGEVSPIYALQAGDGALALLQGEGFTLLGLGKSPALSTPLELVSLGGLPVRAMVSRLDEPGFVVAWGDGLIGPPAEGGADRAPPRFPAYALAAVAGPGLYATGGADGVIRLSTLASGEQLRFTHGAPVHALAATAGETGETVLVYGAADGTVGRLIIRATNYLPPVWAFAALALALVGFAVLIAHIRRARENIHADMRRRDAIPPIADFLASDGPLTDPKNAGRALNALTDRLAGFMTNTSTALPVTFALIGEWGSGKSSAMRLLQRQLAAKAHPTVWFNAWHHQKEEHLFASLMAEVRGQATPGVASFAFYHPRNLTTRWRLLVSRLAERTLRFYLVTFGVAFVGWLAWIVGPKIADAAPAGAAFHWLGLIGPALYFFWVAFDALKTFKINPSVLITSTRSFLGGGAEDARLGFRDEFARSFRELTEALGERRLTIFIDDLDRCRKDQVVEVLEAVNFLVSSGDCYIVLGISEEPVKNAIGLVFDDIAQASAALSDDETDETLKKERKLAKDREVFAERYLEKLINLKVDIPPFDASALEQWLEIAEGRRGAGADESDAPKRGAVMARLARAPFIRALRPPPQDVLHLLRFGGLGAMLLLGVWLAGVSEGDGRLSRWLLSFEHEASKQTGATPGERNPEARGGGDENALAALETAIALKFPPVDFSRPEPPAPDPLGERGFAQQATDPFAATPLMLVFALAGALAFRSPGSRKWLHPPDQRVFEDGDSDAFMRAMGDLLRLIYPDLGSPRAIKRFVNRMRFITAGLSNGEEARIRNAVLFGGLVEIGLLDPAKADIEEAQSGRITMFNEAKVAEIQTAMLGAGGEVMADWPDFLKLNAGVGFSAGATADDPDYAA